MILTGVELDDYSWHDVTCIDATLSLRGLSQEEVGNITRAIGCFIDITRHITKEDRIDGYKKAGMLR